LVPYTEDGIIKYDFQESQVINVHSYEWCTNIRLKYTDMNINRRRRIELSVNKEKYNSLCIACTKQLSYAYEGGIKFGDLIATLYKDMLKSEYKQLIKNKTTELKQLIASYNMYVEKLEKLIPEENGN
jgi:hypothetical protein